MPRVRPCGPLCGLAGVREGNRSASAVLGRFRAAFRCAESGAGESPDAFKHQGTHNIPQCGLFSSFFSDVFFSIGIKR